MPSGTPLRMNLNIGQQRRLVVTLAHAEHILRDAADRLEAGHDKLMFQEYVHDGTVGQRLMAEDYMARLRRAAARTLDAFGVAVPPPSVSALWALRTALSVAQSDLDELRPQALRGYGAMSEPAAETMLEHLADLRALLESASHFFATRSDSGISQRLGRLPVAADFVAAAKALWDIILRHGLTHFYEAMEIIVERLESPVLEVAIFGRVNSGKSSLLNSILSCDLFPVGATPVTAVPVRVSYGPELRIVIVQRQGEAAAIGPEQQLADFITEQRNPDNGKEIARVNVAMPAAPLKDGVAFVDTPGVGSMAAAGAGQSLAYLPRCDVGLVLVDAVSGLSPEDVSLVRAIRQASAAPLLLLTKADLLSAADRRLVLEYTQRAVARELADEVPMFFSSTKDARDLHAWRTDGLENLISRRRALGRQSMHGKIASLRNAVTAALLGPAGRGAGAPAAGVSATAGSGGNDELMAHGIAVIDAVEREGSALNCDIKEIVERIIAATADAMATLPDRRHLDGATLLSFSARRELAELAERTASPLHALQNRLTGILRAAIKPQGSGHEHEVRPPNLVDLPIADLSGELHHADTGAGDVLMLVAPRKRLTTHLRSSEGAELQRAVHLFRQELFAWRSQNLKMIRRWFVAEAGMHLAPAVNDAAPAMEALQGRGPASSQDLTTLEELLALPLAEGES